MLDKINNDHCQYFKFVTNIQMIKLAQIIELNKFKETETRRSSKTKVNQNAIHEDLYKKIRINPSTH